ncbi:hypothetical protein [Empedobacter tilapiae]
MGWIIGQWKPSLEYSFYNVIRNNLGKGGLLSLYQPKNYLKAPKYKSDQEAKGIAVPDEVQVKYKPLTVAGIQRLTEDDYFYTESQDSITLKLAYNYNKTIMEGYTSGVMKEVIDNLWLFNYFNLFKDLSQFYFVPVTTCRYPNQIAMIRVFPDIQWGITFTIGVIDKKYKEDWRKDLIEEKRKLVEEYQAIFNPSLATKKEKTLQKLNLKLGINVKYNNETIDFSPKLGKKIHDVVYNFAVIKELFDTIVGNGEDAPSKAKRTNKYQQATKKSAKFSKLAKLPISIDIGNPAFSVGFTWGYRKIASQGRVTKSYDIFLKAAPIISATGTLDLIALASYVPVAGQAIKIADIVLTAGGVDPDFFIQGKGSLGFGIILKIGEDSNKIDDKTSQGNIGFEGVLKYV